MSESWTYATANSSTATLTGKHKTRLTGFTGGMISQSYSYNMFNNMTTLTGTLDSTNHVTVSSTLSPDSNQPDERVSHAGRLVKATSKTNEVTRYGYDGFGRRKSVTDSRGNTSQTHYDSNGRVDWAKDGADNQTDYAYYATSDTGDDVYPGRLKYVQDPLDKLTYYGYDDQGRVVHTWGHVLYPTATGYDDYGQRVTLTTFRGNPSDPNEAWSGSSWPVSAPGGDTTTWNYDPATGLLEEKTYADDSSVAYTYTPIGDLATRIWARGAVTSYTYGDPNDPNEPTGELLSVSYTDPNGPAITDLMYKYDRLGRRIEVTDAAGKRAFYRDPNKPVLSLLMDCEKFTDGVFENLIIQHQHELTGAMTGRQYGVDIGDANDPDLYYAARHRYATASGGESYGRLRWVTGPGLDGDLESGGAEYWYDPASEPSNLVDRIIFRTADNDNLGYRKWTYDTNRDLITSVRNGHHLQSNPANDVSKYAYGYNELGLRTYKARSRCMRTAIVRNASSFAPGSSA